MLKKSTGSAMILFLVLMPLCLVLAYNVYHTVLYYVRTVSYIQVGRIERRLTEGLLHIGCRICACNTTILMAWGHNQGRTMYLKFPIWPTENKNSLLSSYSGTISIISEHDFLTVSCALQHAGRNCKTGHCTLIYSNPKNPASGLVLKNWSIT